MDEKLKTLFDYQRFENNKKLSELTKKYEDISEKELNLDDLSRVNAAGEIEGNNRLRFTGKNNKNNNEER